MKTISAIEKTAIEKMRKTGVKDAYYLCDFYSSELQPVDFDLASYVAFRQGTQPDLTEKPGIYSDHFSNMLTNQMIRDGVNRLFDEHGSFCVEQGYISRENWKAWFAMIYPEAYAFEEMEYAIGWHNKELKKKRIAAEKIWKSKHTIEKSSISL